MNWVQEIHAYKNEDGTYRIELLGITETTRFRGKHEYKEMREAKVEIGKTSIQVISYPLAIGEKALFILEVKE